MVKSFTRGFVTELVQALLEAVAKGTSNYNGGGKCPKSMETVKEAINSFRFWLKSADDRYTGAE